MRASLFGWLWNVTRPVERLVRDLSPKVFPLLGFETLSKALGFGKGTASNVVSGRIVTPLVAFRVARLAKVGVDDVLGGRFPEPNVCPHCGNRRQEAAE